MAITITLTERERRMALHALVVARNKAIKNVEGRPSEPFVKERWDTLKDKFVFKD